MTGPQESEKPISEETVDHVAALARLEFSPEEKGQLLQELNKIVAYFHNLRSLELDEVDPAFHLLPPGNVLREDVVAPSLEPREFADQAPAWEDEHFVVPKVIDANS